MTMINDLLEHGHSEPRLGAHASQVRDLDAHDEWGSPAVNVAEMASKVRLGVRLARMTEALELLGEGDIEALWETRHSSLNGVDREIDQAVRAGDRQALENIARWLIDECWRD